MTKKNNKLRATDNLAKDVVKPKMKSIPVPPEAAAEISRMVDKLDNYIAGLVAGMGIKGPWGFDMKSKQVLVPDTGES